jgi:hypothetical protein
MGVGTGGQGLPPYVIIKNKNNSLKFQKIYPSENNSLLPYFYPILALKIRKKELKFDKFVAFDDIQYFTLRIKNSWRR